MYGHGPPTPYEAPPRAPSYVRLSVVPDHPPSGAEPDAAQRGGSLEVLVRRFLAPISSETQMPSK